MIITATSELLKNINLAPIKIYIFLETTKMIQQPKENNDLF